ncbi:Uncharacterized protein conserved in bacteria [Rodentibacter pneumotropicus]|uniref:Uncharacterized protein conserved in bacteria n=1 Tax=Rodentibacter pneumotropicus TaxID=758 RepID=A0A448MQQ3_9PAST|nr:Uncharacterized protein conserved in bacteria [Rodentibacter pneumotropicus]
MFPHFVGEPKGKDILKMRLYELQQAKCLYSGKSLELHRLLEKGYVEVDHALPFSRTWDDSFNNKVLVLANENQNKGNLTPYEWLDGKITVSVGNILLYEYKPAVSLMLKTTHFEP